MLETENMIDLLGLLKEMSSEQLSRLIQEETAKESPNDDLVLRALDILEDREKEAPVKLGPKGTAAWKKYQSKALSRQRKTVLNWNPLMKVASVLLVITMLFALLPTQVNAETWWERLARWTDNFFSFFNPNTTEAQIDEYVFRTDNEGLQKVYDAVAQLGIVEPVIPMWLPENYYLSECTVLSSPASEYLYARFSNSIDEIVIQVNIYKLNKSNAYYKNENDVKSIERYGTTYNIMRNTNNWVIIWAIDNIECSIFIDCQEEILYEIIESIYRWRTNE